MKAIGKAIAGYLDAKALRDWAQPFVRPMDQSSVWPGDPKAYQLLASANGAAHRFAAFNADVAARQSPKVYRTAGRGREGRRLNLRTDRKTIAYLKGDTALRPHAKALENLQSGDIVEVEDPEIMAFIRRPSPLQTGTQFRQTKFYYKQIVGDMWAYFTDDNEGRPSLLPMYPQMVALNMDDDGLVRDVLFGRQGSGRMRRYPIEECVCWKFRPSRTDPWRGEGWLVGAIKDARLADLLMLASMVAWENGQRPDYILCLPQEATENQRLAAQAALDAKHRGVRNYGKGMVAIGKTEVKPINFSPKDSLLDIQLAASIDAIRAAAGVPESLEKMNGATYANAAASMIQHRRDTIAPMLDNDAEEDTVNVLPKLGLDPDRYCVAYVGVVAEDEESVRAMVSTMFQTGIATINEMRAPLHLSPVDWGEVPPAPQMYRMPVATPNEQREGMGIEPVEGGDELQGARGPGMQQDQQREEEDEDKPKPDEEDEKRLRWKARVPHKRFDSCCHETKGLPETPTEKAALDAIANAVEAWIQRQAGKFTADASGHVTLTGTVEELQAMLESPIRSAAIGGLGKASRAIGEDDLTELAVSTHTRWLAGYRTRLARELSDGLRSDLTDAIRGGLESGGSLGDIVQSIREVLPEEAPWRALRIARSETSYVSSETAVDLWEEHGIKMRWSLSPDACSVCVAFVEQYASEPWPAGKVLAPEGTPIVGADGKEIVLWRDVRGGGYIHPNCGCSEYPIVEKNQ